MKYPLLVLFALGLFAQIPAPSSAQSFDLEPSEWFPLHVGSYWHYRLVNSGGFETDVVMTAERDSIVDGNRWTAVRDIYCSNSVSCSMSVTRWYHFTDDDYLLVGNPEPSTIEADTLLPTQPYSFFQLSKERDTLNTARVAEPVLATIEIVATGNPADSTNIELHITADGNIFFTDRFIYKIGRSNDLVGAKVNGISYGDTTLLTSVALNTDIPEGNQSDTIRLDAFPNPARSNHISFIISALKPGDSSVLIYNALGQKVGAFDFYVYDYQETTYSWLVPQWLSSGSYLVRLYQGGSPVAQKVIFIK